MDIPVNNGPVATDRPRAVRVRRTPARAQQLILDAAEACMGAAGPAGLRLTQVAARAGVSHPTLLHHFGSRDALVAAVHRRAVERMQGELGALMQASREGSANIVRLVFEAYRGGIAERLIWMLQSGIGLGTLRDGKPVFAGMVEGLHALRRQIAPPGAELRESETRLIIHLITLAAFGDAVIGSRLRATGQEGPAAEAEGRAAFELWFSGLVDRMVAPWT